jgi:hypothetical protein
VAEARGQFGNPEERERPSLEAVTRKLVKAMTENASIYVAVSCKVYPMNPITNLNPVCNHAIT